MYWKGSSLPDWRKRERKRLINYLNQELRPRILRDELMANYEDKKEKELLPDNIVFDRNSKKFFIVERDGSKTELK